jgi:hypothetical protein
MWKMTVIDKNLSSFLLFRSWYINLEVKSLEFSLVLLYYKFFSILSIYSNSLALSLQCILMRINKEHFASGCTTIIITLMSNQILSIEIPTFLFPSRVNKTFFFTIFSFVFNADPFTCAFCTFTLLSNEKKTEERTHIYLKSLEFMCIHLRCMIWITMCISGYKWDSDMKNGKK